METNNNNHWAHKRERGSARGILFLLYCFKFLGATVCKIFITPVVIYFYLFNPDARNNIKCYFYRLKSVCKEAPEVSQLNVFKLFINFGYGICDRMSAWQGNVKKFKLTKSNSDVFTALIKQNKGGIILVSHMGNFEISRMASNKIHDVKFNVFMHTKNSEKFTQVIKKFNPEFAMSLIQSDELNMQIAMTLKEKVDAGEFVVIAGDRVPVANENAIVSVEFLGQEAAFPIGPYVMAKVLGCPLIGLFCTKQGSGYHVDFELIASQVIFNKNNKNEVINQLAENYVESLSEHVKTAPLQWYNFHEFWNQK